MNIDKKHIIKKWEVSMMEFQTDLGMKYKVTRKFQNYLFLKQSFLTIKNLLRESLMIG